MRLDRPLSWLEIILICLLIASWLLIGWWAMEQRADGTAHDCRSYLAEVRQRESVGDYRAVNERPSEWHSGWQTLGSYGAYQIAQPLWNEAAGWMAAEGLRNWVAIRPDVAPAIVQDAIANRLCDRYGRCPWLTGSDRKICWQEIS